MKPLKWSASHAVWFEEIDDEHKEIFEAIGQLQKLLSSSGSPEEMRKAFERLMSSLTEHFAHEERLMQASRYDLLDWHKRLHAGARRKVRQYAAAGTSG